jgi:hypothetical protein
MSSSSPQDESDYTLAQQVAITLVPAFSGTLSLLGSSCIIWMLLAENRKKLKSVKYRFLFALCLCDIVNSLWFVFFSLPIPKDTPGVWGAMGNYASCNTQGFFLQFGIIGSFYNGALSLYFYKSLCSSMKDEQIARRYEKWIHIGCLVWPLGTAIAAWQQDLYSYSGLGCWIAPEPLRCHRREDVDCIRGENAYIYAWVYTGIPLILLCMCIVYSMTMIYMKVKEVSRRAEMWSTRMVLGASSLSNPSRVDVTQWSDRNINDGSLHARSEAASQRGSISGKDNRDRSGHAERTKEVAWQAFLYVIAYVVTHMWAFVVVNIELGGGTTPAYLVLIENFFWPLQGFANVFIFLRPRIKSIQRSSPEMFYFTAAYHSVFHYDEIRRLSSKPANSPARPGEERLSKRQLSYASDSFPKTAGEESDASSVPATNGMNESRQQKEDNFQPVIHEKAEVQHDADEKPTITEVALFAQITGPNESRYGMNESRQQKEDNFQPVIHEEAPVRHDADENPTITEDALFTQITGPNESRNQEEDNFEQVIQEEAPVRHDADEQPTITEDALFAQSTGRKMTMVKSVLFDDEVDHVK